MKLYLFDKSFTFTSCEESAKALDRKIDEVCSREGSKIRETFEKFPIVYGEPVVKKPKPGFRIGTGMTAAETRKKSYWKKRNGGAA